MQSSDRGQYRRESTTPATTAIAATETTFTSNYNIPSSSATTTATNNNNETPSRNPFKQESNINDETSASSRNRRRLQQNDGDETTGTTASRPSPRASQRASGGRESFAASNNRQQRGWPPPDDQRQENRQAAGVVSAFKDKLAGWRKSRGLVLIIVAIALLLDNMLLTVVVPIIPEFLYEIHHPDGPINNVSRPTNLEEVASTPVPCPCLNTDNATALTTPIPQENVTKWQESQELQKELMGETVEVGLMFASKAFVQLLVNPIVGELTHRIGYSVPMFFGFLIMFASTLVFAFGRSYLVLFTARAMQGVGSACSSVAGMGMLADRYTDDKERGNAMGIALGGLALGVLIGPPFGGLMFEFVGKTTPFLILSGLALGDGLLQLFMLRPSIERTNMEPTSLKTLISDPYILIAAGAITFANMGIAMLEPSLPLWMMSSMNATRWEQGVAFLPASISYLIGTNIFGPLGHKMGRWLAALLGLIIIGICLTMVPLAHKITDLILPHAGLGFAIGMVDSSMMPELGYLVDIRHSAVYGAVYALGDVAFCVGFALGPALSGTLVKTIGFHWMLIGIALICFIYSPLLLLLKNPPTKDEKKVGGDDTNDNNNVVPIATISNTMEQKNRARIESERL